MQLSHDQLREWVALILKGAPNSEISKAMRDLGHPDHHREFVRKVAAWGRDYQGGKTIEELKTIIVNEGFTTAQAMKLIKMLDALVVPFNATKTNASQAFDSLHGV